MASITNPFQANSKRTVASPFQNQPPMMNQPQNHFNNEPPKASKLPPPKSSSSSTYNNNNPSSNLMAPPMSDFQPYETQQSELDSILAQYESIKQFNCDPCFLTPTSEVFPATLNTLKDSNFPVGLSISPLSTSIPSSEIPILKYGKDDIPRCVNNACRAYLNPFVKFIEGGHKWVCNFCKQTNTTEDHYYCRMNNEGIREDQYTKTELSRGTYEFETNEKYWKKGKLPTSALFIFMIETSGSAVQNGYLSAVIESIKDVVNNSLLYNKEAKIAILTYDAYVSFYAFGEKMTQPQMLCVSSEPVFLPTIKEHLLFRAVEDKDKILSILDYISNIYNNNPTNIKDSNKIISCLNGAYLLGRSLGGKIVIFSSSNSLSGNPKLNAITSSDNQTKEQLAYSPHDKKQLGHMGINLTNDNMSVDLFISADTSINLYTMNQLSEYTNGNIYFYKNFRLDTHYKSIYNQIRRVLSREITWEGVLRTRFSHGYRINDFLTPVLISNRDLFVLPTYDADQHYQVGLSLLADTEQNIKENPSMKDNFLYIQSALLYSYGDGTRRIRVHNLCLPLSNSMKDIYEHANCEMTSLHYMKASIDKLYKSKSLNDAIVLLENNFKSMVSSYFKFSNYSSRKRELCDSLSAIPVYMLGLYKNRIFCKDEIEKRLDIDLSNYLRVKLQRMEINEAMSFILPKIYPIDLCYEDSSIGQRNNETGEVLLPDPVDNTQQSLASNGLFLIDNGFLLIIYVRQNTPRNILMHLFGVEDIEFITENPTEETVFAETDDIKERIMNIIDNFRG